MIAKTIPLEKVESSNIDQIGYDLETQTVAVLFTNGSLYHYENVEPKKYAAFVASISKGQFLHYELKGKHRFTRVA